MVFLASFVQKLASAIHRINHYPVNKYQGNPLRYPLERVLSVGLRYPLVKQMVPGYYNINILKTNRMEQLK